MNASRREGSETEEAEAREDSEGEIGKSESMRDEEFPSSKTEEGTFTSDA